MRVLLVSDLHYDLRTYDWVASQAPDHDLVALAGDLLNIASPVPLDVQISVVLEYVARLATVTTVAVCSGNHDLDTTTPSGEKATSWLQEAAAAGVVVDGGSTVVAGWQVSSCAWWEGPTTLAAVEAALQRDDAATPWLWVWHGPPSGPLAWDGKRQYDDPELPRLLDTHRPDVVLCGHIHQAPFLADGGWAQQRGATWLFNAGAQRGPTPCSVSLELPVAGDGTATWRSQQGEESVRLTR